MFERIKRFFGREVSDIVVTPAESGEEAIMQNALLALKTGKVVYGGYEKGVLTSTIVSPDGE